MSITPRPDQPAPHAGTDVDPGPAPLIDARYEPIAVVGTGASGDVTLACHRGSGHHVVLKSLRSRQPDDALRFVREATLLAMFDHPCIPRFYDHAPAAAPPYIAMARAPGVPAARYIPPGELVRLRAIEVAQIGLQLADTLDYIHARGVLHRDINANNVLVDLQRTPRITLIDFGRAALTDKFLPQYSTPPQQRVEIPDGGIETLPWTAPEVRADHGFSDRSDVYSLGLLLYRLLTGKKLTTSAAGHPDSPRVHAAKCPQDIALAVQSALHPDPQQRPTAAQLAARLRDAVDDDDSTAEAEHAIPPPPTHDRTTRGWTHFMAATADPTAPTEPAGADVLPFHPRDILDRATTLDPDFPAKTPAPAPTTPRRPAVIAAVLLLAAAAVVWFMRRPPAPPGSGDPGALAHRSPETILSPTLTRSPPAHPPVISPAETLELAKPALIDCARIAGGEVSVELATRSAESRFTTIDVFCDAAGGITCAKDVLASLRFTPTTRADTFIQHYRP